MAFIIFKEIYEKNVFFWKKLKIYIAVHIYKAPCALLASKNRYSIYRQKDKTIGFVV